MVTKQQQQDIIVGPKAAVWLCVSAAAIVVLAWVMASHPLQQKQTAAYDQIYPPTVMQEQYPNNGSPPERRLQTSQKNAATPESMQ